MVNKPRVNKDRSPAELKALVEARDKEIAALKRRIVFLEGACARWCGGCACVGVLPVSICARTCFPPAAKVSALSGEEPDRIAAVVSVGDALVGDNTLPSDVSSGPVKAHTPRDVSASLFCLCGAPSLVVSPASAGASRGGAGSQI